MRTGDKKKEALGRKDELIFVKVFTHGFSLGAAEHSARDVRRKWLLIHACGRF